MFKKDWKYSKRKGKKENKLVKTENKYSNKDQQNQIYFFQNKYN